MRFHFPIVALIVSAIIVIVSIIVGSEAGIQTGGSISGIAGTAYHVYKKSQDENL